MCVCIRAEEGDGALMDEAYASDFAQGGGGECQKLTGGQEYI